MCKHLPVDQVEAESLHVPNIFADGKHDDLPGLVAAIENKPVMFDGELYAPSRSINIAWRYIVISRCLYVLGSDSEPETAPFPGCDNFVACREGNPAREIHIDRCKIESKCPHDAAKERGKA